MANKWLSHVKATLRRLKSSGKYHKGDGLKDVIKEAKKTYHGGASGSSLSPLPLAGGRRKTRRHSRK